MSTDSEQFPPKLNPNHTTGAQPGFSNPLVIEFKDFDTNFFTSKQDESESDGWLDSEIEHYVIDTVQGPLNELFKGMEQFYPQAPIDRNMLMIVDGKPVYEQIRGNYFAQFIKSQSPSETQMQKFKNWYAENAQKLGNQIVAAGLLTGKDVEAFVPDANNELPVTPVQIKGSGYTHSTSSGAVLDAWKQYFKSLGFEEAALDLALKGINTRSKNEDIDSIKEYPTSDNPRASKAQHDLEEARQWVRNNYVQSQKAPATQQEPNDNSPSFGMNPTSQSAMNPTESSLGRWNEYVNIIKAYLDDQFKDTEQSCIGDAASHIIADRASLVIVGNKTVYERMQELYRDKKVKTPKNLPFEKWYQANLKEMSAQIVVAGLIAGERLEIYVPGDKEMLQTELEKSDLPFNVFDISFADLERYFEFGFDIFDTDIENIDDNRIEGLQERRIIYTRERMHAHYHVAYTASKAPDSPAMINMFFGESMKEYNGSWEQFAKQFHDCPSFQNPSRAVSACICYLATQKDANGNFYKLEDILDPNKLQQEKLEAAKEYMKHALNGNVQTSAEYWLGDIYFQGQKAIVKQIDEIMKNTNLNDSQQRKAMLPTLYGAGRVLQYTVTEVLSEDASDVKAGYETAVRNSTSRKSSSILKRVYNVGTFFEKLFEGNRARTILASPLVQEDDVKKAVADLATEQWALEQQAAKAGKKRTFQATVPDGVALIQLRNIAKKSKTVQVVAPRFVEKMSKAWKERANDILNGSMNDAFIFHNGLRESDIYETPDPEIKLLISTKLQNELDISATTTPQQGLDTFTTEDDDDSITITPVKKLSPVKTTDIPPSLL